MKKLHIIYIITITALLLALAFSACGSQKPAADAGPGQAGGAAAFGGDSPDLYGQVDSISGNDVTLAVLELPQQRFSRDRGPGQPSESGRARSPGQNSGDGRDRDSGQVSGGSADQGQGQSSPGSGNRSSGRPSGDGRIRPSGGTGADGGQGGAPRRGNGAGGFANMQGNYTGETMTLNIPSDTPISALERGDKGMTEKQLAFGDIKQGSLLQVWYKKDSGDSKEIERIRLIEMPAANPASGN